MKKTEKLFEKKPENFSKKGKLSSLPLPPLSFSFFSIIFSWYWFLFIIFNLVCGGNSRPEWFQRRRIAHGSLPVGGASACGTSDRPHWQTRWRKRAWRKTIDWLIEKYFFARKKQTDMESTSVKDVIKIKPAGCLEARVQTDKKRVIRGRFKDVFLRLHPFDVLKKKITLLSKLNTELNP